MAPLPRVEFNTAETIITFVHPVFESVRIAFLLSAFLEKCWKVVGEEGFQMFFAGFNSWEVWSTMNEDENWGIVFSEEVQGRNVERNVEFFCMDSFCIIHFLKKKKIGNYRDKITFYIAWLRFFFVTKL